MEYSGNLLPLQPIRVFQNGQLFKIRKQKSFPKRITLYEDGSININKQYNGN